MPEHYSSSMECIAALIANLSQRSATLSIVCLAVSSIIRSAKRRASLARWCQNLGSISGAMSMERSHMRKLLKMPWLTCCGTRGKCRAPHSRESTKSLLRKLSAPAHPVKSMVHFACYDHRKIVSDFSDPPILPVASCPLRPQSDLVVTLMRNAARGQQRKYTMAQSITSSGSATSCEPNSPRGLEIDRQLALGRRLHRYVGRLLALEDSVYK
jgi:hypothetical protein